MSPGVRGAAGNAGERQVIRLVPCPNCDKPLVRLPTNYPLYDVQCSACSFRAQVKTSNSRPKDQVYGAGWDIVEKVLKAGFLMPPLFVNFQWIEGGRRHRRIVFYPFAPRTHLARYVLSDRARRAGYRMFRYVALSKLPHSDIFES